MLTFIRCAQLNYIFEALISVHPNKERHNNSEVTELLDDDDENKPALSVHHIVEKKCSV